MASLEGRGEEADNAELDRLDVARFGKNKASNAGIRRALDDYESKSGGDGRNHPDIQALLDDGRGWRIPVMMECEDLRGKLLK